MIEAKRRDEPLTEGVGQAKDYAEKLQTRFAYATNGQGIYRDRHGRPARKATVAALPDARTSCGR